MTFPTTPILDNFTGVNGTSPPNAHWTEPAISGDGGLQIQGNAATSDNASFGSAYWNAGPFGPNTEAHVTMVTKPGSAATDTAYIFTRQSDPGAAGSDGYYYEFYESAGTDRERIYEVTNLVFTALGADNSLDFANGDAFGGEDIGNTHTFYRKPAGGSWGALFSRTDAAHTGAGYISLGCENTAARLDDFGGGTVVEGQPAPIRTFGIPTGRRRDRPGGWN